MDFSLSTLYILPSGNTLPTTGTTSDLTPSQFGVFLNTYAVATTGNIAAAPYIYVAQGRNVPLPGVGSKRSDKINVNQIIDWYKVPAVQTFSPEIVVINNFTVQCGETITFTFRLHSSYIDTGFFNGLQKSYTVQAPCCACGVDPCTNLDVTALIDALIAKIQAESIVQAYSINRFLSFQRVGSGASASLVVTGKPLTVYGQPCDIAAYPYEFDRLWFRAFVFPGAATTQDFQVVDNCDLAGTVTVTQRATYPSGTSSEITQLEKNDYSYQALHKHLFRNAIFNNAFTSEVVAGTFYDTYYLKLKEYKQQDTWGDYVAEDFTVILAVPTGQTATLETLLTTYLGAPANKVVTVPTTTSTTSTTSTSTTSTTTLEP